MAVVLASGWLLSACTNQNSNQSTTTNSTGNQMQQNGQTPSGTPQGRAQGQQSMDLAAAAEKLGVTEEKLRSALGIEEMPEVTPGAETTPGARPSGQPKQMDLATAAETLGVTETELREALGVNDMPSGGPEQNGNRSQGSAPTTQE